MGDRGRASVRRLAPTALHRVLVAEACTISNRSLVVKRVKNTWIPLMAWILAVASEGNCL